MLTAVTRPETPSIPLEVSVVSRDCPPLSDRDIRRLFPALTAERLDRIREWPRVLVAAGDVIVGAATCQRLQDELVVPDVGLSACAGCADGQVLLVLADALETACLAGGSRRVVVNAPRAALRLLASRGYGAIDRPQAGCWIAKTLS